MEKENAIGKNAIGKTPSLNGPSGAVKSAVGVNDLRNSTAADNNKDGTVASPLSTAPNKRLFYSNKRPSTSSPSSYSPLKGQSKKKSRARETKHRRRSKSTWAYHNPTNARVARPSSPESPMKANNLDLKFASSPRKTRSSKPKKGRRVE